MAVNHGHREGPALDILETLDDEDSAVVGAHDEAGVVLGEVEGLVGDLLVGVEETVLEAREVVFGDEFVQTEFVEVV